MQILYAHVNSDIFYCFAPMNKLLFLINRLILEDEAGTILLSKQFLFGHSSPLLARSKRLCGETCVRIDLFSHRDRISVATNF